MSEVSSPGSGAIILSVSVSTVELATWAPDRIAAFLRGMALVLGATKGVHAKFEAASDVALAGALANVDAVQRVRGTADFNGSSRVSPEPEDLVPWELPYVISFWNATSAKWQARIQSLLEGPKRCGEVMPGNEPRSACQAFLTRARQYGNVTAPVQIRAGFMKLDSRFADLLREHLAEGSNGRDHEPAASALSV